MEASTCGGVCVRRREATMPHLVVSHPAPPTAVAPKPPKVGAVTPAEAHSGRKIVENHPKTAQSGCRRTRPTPSRPPNRPQTPPNHLKWGPRPLDRSRCDHCVPDEPPCCGYWSCRRYGCGCIGCRGTRGLPSSPYALPFHPDGGFPVFRRSPASRVVPCGAYGAVCPKVCAWGGYWPFPQAPGHAPPPGC